MFGTEWMILSLTVEKIIINQIFLSKLWYIGQIYHIKKIKQNKIILKEYTISSWNERNTILQAPSSTLHLEYGLDILDINWGHVVDFYNDANLFYIWPKLGLPTANRKRIYKHISYGLWLETLTKNRKLSKTSLKKFVLQ